jgi:hypothetical protein
MLIGGLSFQVTTKLQQVTNKTLTPPSQIKFVKNVREGHVQGFSQVLKRLFPFNPPIILQGIPNDMTCAPWEILLFPIYVNYKSPSFQRIDEKSGKISENSSRWIRDFPRILEFEPVASSSLTRFMCN